MRISSVVRSLVIFGSLWLGAAAFAETPVGPAESLEEDVAEESDLGETGYLNLETKTLGGRQFWGDVCFFHGYRIQQNVITGHYRLLNPNDVRQAWGTEEHCRAALEKIRTDQQLPKMSGKAVILIHGIFRSSKSLSALGKRFEQEGYTVVPFDYPSTRVTIAESAEYLKKVLDSLEGVEEIDLVVHSMGGLLVRESLKGETPPDPRLHRMVMLGTPNRGARMANVLQNIVLYKWLFGPAGQQLIEGDNSEALGLPVPNFEFAIIAGARGKPDGWNPLINGDDDGTVAVESTKLPGAADFLTITSMHTFMMSNPEVIEAAFRFIKTGSLHEDGTKTPIIE